MEHVQRILAAPEPPRWAVWIVSAVVALCAVGTTVFWGSVLAGREYCVECVPLGLSTFRFLHWPLADFFMDILYISTVLGLLRKWRFAYLIGATLGFAFEFMAVLAIYSSVTSGAQVQPHFLTLYFMGFGGFLLWFMHHWRGHWSSAGSSGEARLPSTQRKRGAI